MRETHQLETAQKGNRCSNFGLKLGVEEGKQAALAGSEWGHISPILMLSSKMLCLVCLVTGILYGRASLLLLLSQRSAVGLKLNHHSYITAHVLSKRWGKYLVDASFSAILALLPVLSV